MLNIKIIKKSNISKLFILLVILFITFYKNLQAFENDLKEITYDIYQINDTKIYYIRSYNKLLSSVGIINKIGAYYDELSGQAHLCEHIFFKNKYNGKYIKYILSNFGASYNAATFNDFIVFYFTSNNYTILKNINIFLYSVFNPSFDNIDVDTEKNVVITELNTTYQYENIYKIFSKYYKPTGGTINDVKKIDYNILYNYWKKNYTPQNLTIIIYSSLPFNYFKDSILSYFKGNLIYIKSNSINLKDYKQIENNLKTNYDKFINFIKDRNSNLLNFEILESKDYIYFYTEVKDNIIYYDLLSEIINKKSSDLNKNNDNNKDFTIELSSSLIPTKLSNFFIIKIKKINKKDNDFYKNYISNLINTINYEDFKYGYLKVYSDYVSYFSGNFDFIQFFSFLVALNLLDIIKDFFNIYF